MALFGREKVGDAYVTIHADGDPIDDDIKDAFGNADPAVKDAGRRHSKVYGEEFDREERRSNRLLRMFRQRFDRISRDPKIKASARRLGRSVGDAVAEWAKGDSLKDFDDTLIRDFNRLSMTARHTGQDFSDLDVDVRRTEQSTRRFGDTSNRTRRHMLNLGNDTHRFRNAIARLDDRVDIFSNHVGTIFGRGSRNNFLNFIGSMARNFTLIAFNSVPKLIQQFLRLKDGIVGIGKAFSEGGFLGGMKHLGGLAGKGTAGLVALGVAAVALVAIIGPLVSIISGLLAAITALAGSVVFAAAGALGALTGAMLPLAAGIGVAIFAIQGLSRAHRKLLKDAVKPLTDELHTLGATARHEMVPMLVEAAHRIAPAFRGLRPMFRGIGQALGDVAINFANNLNSPGFRAFKRDMTDFLPRAVRKLGFSFTDFLGGMGGVFRSLIPITRDFLNWLTRITDDFNRWANSAKGQRELKQFWRDAAESAKSVGRFIREAVVALGTLLGMGRSTGDTIFDTMADKLREFTNWLRANPNAIQDWFAHGKQTIDDIGNAVMGLVHVFQAIDSPATRFLAHGLFEGLRLGLSMFTAAITFTLGPTQTLIHVLGFLVEGIGRAMNGLNSLTPFANPFGDMGDKLESAGRSMQKFSVLTSGAKSASSSATGQFQSMASTLDQVSGAATEATRQLILQKLTYSGAAQAANAYGISNRDLIDAVLGSDSATRRINDTLSHAGSGARQVAEDLGKLGVQFDRAGNAVRRNNADMTSWREALHGIKSRRIRLAIEATGMEPTIGEFRRLIRTAHLTPRQVRIAAKATNAQLTHKQLLSLLNLSRNLDKQKPNIKPKVERNKPTRDIQAIQSAGKKLSDQKITPTPVFKNAAAMSSINHTMARLNEVNRNNPSPTVHIGVTGEAALRAALGLLNSFHDRSVTVTTHHNSTGTTRQRATATGGVFGYAQNRLIAEAGREAVVPLDRPLGLVDPSVRELAAFAQGKPPPTAAGGVFPGGGRTINIENLQLVSPQQDPAAVAQEFTNRLVAVMYG